MRWATATDLAGALVRDKDVPWRTAHQIVGILVRLCEERNITPAGVTPALLDEAAVAYHGDKAGLDAQAIKTALDPGRFIAARTGQGGPAPTESLRQADLFAKGLQADTAAVSTIRQRIAESARKLEAAIDTIIGRQA